MKLNYQNSIYYEIKNCFKDLKKISKNKKFSFDKKMSIAFYIFSKNFFSKNIDYKNKLISFNNTIKKVIDNEKNLLLKKKLKAQGYIVIKNLISKRKIKLLILDLIKLFLYEMGLKDTNPSIKLLENKNFDKKLIDFRKKEPEKFSIVYNIIKGNSCLMSILNDKKILNYASKILETDKTSIWNGEFQLRMDTPFDKRNSLDWHQDASYYRDKTIDGSNGLVMWIALSKNIKKRHGAIKVCPGSHKEGVLSTKNVVTKSRKFKKEFKDYIT